jgi:hypothetical protein
MHKPDPEHISEVMLEQILHAGLPESEMARLEEHLKVCEFCRARLRQLQQEPGTATASS